MLLYWLLYFFVAFGAKLVLALVMIYLLLPTESSCNQCDEETLLLQLTPSTRLIPALFLGRLQRRWCPRCGWEGYARLPRPDRARRRWVRRSDTADTRPSRGTSTAPPGTTEGEGDSVRSMKRGDT